jgi:hypothetical protein
MLAVAVVSVVGAAVAAGSVVPSAAAPLKHRTAPVSNSASLWRQLDGSGARSRSNPYERVLTVDTIANARLQHVVQTPLAGSFDDETCSASGTYGPATSPLLEPGGRLFAVTSNALDEFNVATGRLTHTRALPNERTSYAAVTRGIAVTFGVDCDSVSDPTGPIQGAVATTGVGRWRDSLGAAWVVETAPYVVSVGSGSDTDSGFETRNLTTGKVVWATTNQCNYGQPPAIVGGEVFEDRCDPAGAQHLSAYRLSDGSVTWSRAGSYTIFRGNSDTSATAQLYVQKPDGAVVALSARTGAQLHRLSGATDVIAADHTRVYATCGTNGAEVCAFRKTTGALVWRVAQAVATVRTPTSSEDPLIAVGGGVVYLDTGAALNAATGKALARLWTGSTATSLAVGDGYLVANTGDGKLRIYGLSR